MEVMTKSFIINEIVMLPSSELVANLIEYQEYVVECSGGFARLFTLSLVDFYAIHCLLLVSTYSRPRRKLQIKIY